MRNRWAYTVGLLFFLAAQTAAQQVRGIVRDSTVGGPLPGVVVIVLDSMGAPGARTITDAGGRFTVAAPLAAARLRVMRIGYRLRDVAIPAQRESDLQIAMHKIPPLLERVRVSEGALCPGSTDLGTAFQLWEQARAGLLAAVVARDLKPADAKTLIYESILSSNDETVRRQTKHFRSGRTTRPFSASAEPQHFARVGYMVDDPAARTFNAPDVDVLLHESFAATHCFRLRAADRAHAGQVGLAFSPTPGRDTIVDVNGVIWLDASAARLLSLDFEYTALEPAAMATRPGGHIEFRTMPNGVSFIERWSLRLPSVQVNPFASSPRATSDTRRVPRWERTDVRVPEIIEAGGIVVEAKWADGTFWSDTPATASGVVRQNKSDRGAPNVVVTLVGTADSTTTNDAGAFELRSIPGRYLVQAADTMLGSFVKPRSVTRPVVVSRGAAQPVQLELPSFEDVTAGLCGRPLREEEIILSGLVSSTDASSLRGTTVRAEWQVQSMRATNVSVSSRAVDVEVDDDGRFMVCGVLRERPATLLLFKGANRLADTTFRVPPANRAHRLLWLVSPRAPSTPH